MSQRSPQIVRPAPERHEDAFLARYGALRGWALRLAAGDRARAEDLVQDAYVHFTSARPDLSRVENLDGYLYTMLRNLNTSQLRRAARLRDRALPVVEYDSAAGAARAADPRDAARVQDELRACCRYACARKGTSKAGSVLALRFFHGYYPREIAAFGAMTREGVEERLRAARAEARQFLEDPAGLRFMRATQHVSVRFEHEGFARPTDVLLADLRRALFDAREGACPPAGRLARLSRAGAAPLDTKTLAHVVSCPRCIDEVNRLLGLAPLAERFPVDVTGAETRAKERDAGGGGGGDDGSDDGDAGGGGADDGGGGASAGGVGERELLRLRRRARDLYEHRPRELCVAVNGRILAAQKTGAVRCEQRLSVPAGERVEFVEVLSEQEVPLLLLDVNEHLAGASREMSASVALSDERRLEAHLTLGGAWPSVQVVYEEPRLSAERASHTAAGEAQSPADEPRRASRLARLLAKASGRFTGSGFWLRPATLTAALAVVVVAALLLTRMSVPAASAAELLARSSAAEEKLAADAGLVLHRTYVVEESAAGGGATSQRLKVEVWQSAARGLKLRRAYDRAGALVAGEWERADGTRTVYGAALGARAGAEASDPRALAAAGDLWRLDLSPRTFSTLVGDPARVAVEDGLGAYVLSYRADAASGFPEGALASATLRLSKVDLRATGQTLVVRRGGADRVYRFIESGFEKIQHEKVEPKVFEPDAELLTRTTLTANAPVAQGGAPAAESSSVRTAPTVASPELEVEVAYLLSRIRADLGEQVTLTRTTGGQLRVEALAETDGRKEEILRALGPVLQDPAVVVDVSTVGERLARERGRARRESAREVEVSAGPAPADAELRRYFSARVAGERAVELEVRQFGARAMNRARATLLHASALRGMVARFTPAEARALGGDARAKWLAMLSEHARAVQREVRALDGELRPVFSQGGGGGGAAALETSPTVAAEKLVGLAYATDETVRSAFTATAGGGAGAVSIRSPQFWRSLRTAEALASSILAAYEK